MGDEWLWTPKPAFLAAWRALSGKEEHQVLEKIKLLEHDPTPDGKTKMQLKYVNRDIYRLRSGYYRIFYTFRDPYISLLKLVRRDDDTYDDDLEAEFLGGFDPDIEVTFREERQPDWFAPPAQEKKRLSQAITAELLVNLRVPEEHHARLLSIQTEDELLDCTGVPQEHLAHILDYIFPPTLAQILQQPDYIIDDLDELIRYKEGELLGFLLRLSPEQERFVSWAIRATGPTQVKGGPGTGKSIVALYRVRSLIEKLRKMGQLEPSILFTTYTNALVHSSEQLLKQLLGEDARFVEAQTADKKMSDILKRAGVPKKTPNDNDIIQKIFQRALKQTQFEGNVLQQQAQQQSLERLALDYLLDEINQVIVARQIESLQDYMSARRPGRKVRLSDMQKRGIWQVHQTFQRHLKYAGVETWQQARAILVKLCKDPSRLFITADANQSIYGSGFNWSDVHESLKFQGRTSILRANYRSTREIGEAAQSYLATGILDAEPVERMYVNNGPLPVVRSIHNDGEEIRLLVRFLRGAAHELRLGIGSCAVLCPANETGKAIAANLIQGGVEATFMESRDLDLSQKGVKVLTLNSAKGLEFPVVALAGFSGSRYNYFSSNVVDEKQEEDLARARRLIFVGMTRAMRALVVVVPAGTCSPLLTGFDATYWNLGI